MTQLNISNLNTDEAIEAASQRYLNTMQRYKPMLVVTGMYLALGMVVTLAAAVGQKQAFSLGECVLFLLSVIAGFVWLEICDRRFFAASRALPELMPLAGSSHCKDALALCQRSVAAQRIREKVLASGRQLYQFDYNAMREAADRENDEKGAKEQAEACRELHGHAA